MKVTIIDDRTPQERTTHACAYGGTDRVLSGWGGASGGASYAFWAYRPRDRERVVAWVDSRGDLIRRREVVLDGYAPDPRYCAHCHIYVVREGHPALG